MPRQLRTDAHMQTHLTKIVTAMSRFTASGLDKKHVFDFKKRGQEHQKLNLTYYLLLNVM